VSKQTTESKTKTAQLQRKQRKKGYKKEMEWQRHESWKLVGTSTSGKHETDRPANKYSSSSSSSLLRRLLLLPLLNNNSAAHHTFVIKKSSTSASPLPRLSVCCVSLALSLSVYFVRASERASERGCCSSSVATRERCAHATSIRVRERERENGKKQKNKKEDKIYKRKQRHVCAEHNNQSLVN
jgi:hypothetical protein